MKEAGGRTASMTKSSTGCGRETPSERLRVNKSDKVIVTGTFMGIPLGEPESLLAIALCAAKRNMVECASRVCLEKLVESRRMKVIVMDRRELIRNAVTFLSDSTVSNGEHHWIRLTICLDSASTTGTAGAVSRSQGPHRTRNRGGHETSCTTDLSLAIFSSANPVSVVLRVFPIAIPTPAMGLEGLLCRCTGVDNHQLFIHPQITAVISSTVIYGAVSLFQASAPQEVLI